MSQQVPTPGGLGFGKSGCTPLCRFLLGHGQLVGVVLLCSHKALPVLVSPGQPLHPLMTCLTCRHLVSCLGNLSSALWTSTMPVAKRGHRTRHRLCLQGQGSRPSPRDRVLLWKSKGKHETGRTPPPQRTRPAQKQFCPLTVGPRTV